MGIAILENGCSARSSRGGDHRSLKTIFHIHSSPKQGEGDSLPCSRFIHHLHPHATSSGCHLLHPNAISTTSHRAFEHRSPSTPRLHSSPQEKSLEEEGDFPTHRRSLIEASTSSSLQPTPTSSSLLPMSIQVTTDQHRVYQGFGDSLPSSKP